MIEELRQLLKHTSVYGLGNILGKALAFFMIPFYTHFLSPIDYGTAELLDLSVSVIALIANAWITGPVLRFYYHYEADQDRKRVISTAVIGSAVFSAILAGTAWLLARQAARLILGSDLMYGYVRIEAVSLFFSCLFSAAWSYLRARQLSRLLVTIDLVALFVGLSLNIALIGFCKMGVRGLLLSSAISGGISTTYISIHALRQVGYRFDRRKFQELVCFGAPLIFTSAAAFILNFSDRFFLQRMADTATVGIYSLGYKFGYMINFLIVQPFMLIWGARAYELAKTKHSAEYFSRIAEYFVLVLVTAGLGLSLVIREVVMLIAAPQFWSAYIIVPLIASAYVFQGLASYVQAGILVEKKTRYMAVIGLASAASNLALNYVLISRYRAMGAAAATALSFAVLAALSFMFAQKAYPVPYRGFRLLAPCALAAGLFIVSEQISVHNIVAVLACKLALFLAFPLGLYLIRYFDSSELEKIRAFCTVARAQLARTASA